MSRFYADLAPLRWLQALADLGLLAWCALWLRLGALVHDRVGGLAASGVRAEQAGESLRRSFEGAAGRADDIPLVGDRLASPFRDAAGAAAGLAESGRSLQDAVARAALLLGVLVALLPLVVALAAWLRWRVAWLRGAAAVRSLHPTDADVLLASRAVAGRPLPQLSRLAPGTLAGWRAGDPAATATLAALERRDLGLRPPRAPAGQRPAVPPGPR